LAITQDGFERIGARIARLGLPCLMVQEGGYISDSLGTNLTRFLSGIRS
jgi:acetoin utilization deacetylase AcuC-like enzyme